MSEKSTASFDAAPPNVSRRTALRVLGAVPLGSALIAEAWAQQPAQPQQPRQTHETPNQPAHGPIGPAHSQRLPHFFTKAEIRAASVLADDIIPQDDRSPGATAVGVPAFLDFHLSVPETSEETRVAIRGGFQWLDRESRTRFGVSYASAPIAQRHQLLDDIAWASRARPEMSQGVAFFARFRDLVASAFFSSAAGWKDLQYQGNVFNPEWHGCPDTALQKLGVSYAVMKSRVPPQ